MKKAGYGGVKAGAIETMSSVNGQIMPPVMGAAAFLMVEYVGIPYSEIVKHAILPAMLSYIGLLLHRPPRGAEARHAADAPAREPQPRRDEADRASGSASPGRSSCCARSTTCSPRVQSAARRRGALGDRSASCSRALRLVASAWRRASPTCRRTSTSTNPRPLETWPTVRAGLHFLHPDRHADLVPDGRGDVARRSRRSGRSSC